jgi:hypothetical protein
MAISADIDSFAARMAKQLAKDIEEEIRMQFQIIADKVVEDAAAKLARATAAGMVMHTRRNTMSDAIEMALIINGKRIDLTTPAP